MSGRAGRRGKDERGICIIMVDEQVILLLVNSLLHCFSLFLSHKNAIVTSMNASNFGSLLQWPKITCKEA